MAEKYRGGLGTHHAVRGHLDAAGEVREGCRLDIVRVSPHGVGHERRLASSRPGRTESGISQSSRSVHAKKLVVLLRFIIRHD